MMYQCPITFFTDNLIFNADKSCWAVFRLAGYGYDFMDDEVKISMLYKMARFLAGVMSEAQILIVPVEQDSKEQFRNLVKGLDKEDPLYERAVYHAKNTESYLEQVRTTNGQSNDYHTYLVVKMEKYGETELVHSLKTAFDFFVRNPVNAVNTFMALDTRDILVSRMNECRKMASDWLYNQNLKMRMEAVPAAELQWLIRRISFRGINKRVQLFEAGGGREWTPKVQQYKTGAGSVIRPYGKDVINLFSGTIYPDNHMIKVVHGGETVSYQTFLAVTNIPDTLEYPGTEWIYMLQQKNMQAEICIHIKAVENREAKKKLEYKKREIDSQMEHITRADADIPDDLLEGREYADALEKELKDLRAPLLYTGVTLCIAAEDRETLEKRTADIKEEYEDLNFVLERPYADQLNMFMQCIPSVGCIIRDYVMPLTPITLSGGVIGATHELGDKQGPYIATTGREGKQVFLDLGLACLKNKSASATFYGNLGVGKSFNANLLLVLNVLYGGYGLIFDPKAERGHWEEQLGVLKGYISTVTLAATPENKGKLDPYNIYRDAPKTADELAVNVLAELLKIAPTSIEYTAILEAQRIMGETEGTPSMLKMVEILGSFPEEDELYEKGKFLSRRLKLQSGSGMSQLLFGDGSEQAISLDNRLNILQIDNLQLPGADTPKDNYTVEENLSTVLMAVIGNFARRFAMTSRDTFKLILFDESWVLGKTAEGVKLYDFLTRMGRSLYTGCIFNGHSVLDMPTEGIKNTISYKFCFQTTNDDEAARMCEYMGMQATEMNLEAFKNLGNGECIFQDLDGRIGKLKFDAVFQDLIDVFSTTPKKKKAEAEEPEETVKEPEIYDFEYDDEALYRKEEI